MGFVKLFMNVIFIVGIVFITIALTRIFSSNSLQSQTISTMSKPTPTNTNHSDNVVSTNKENHSASTTIASDLMEPSQAFSDMFGGIFN